MSNLINFSDSPSRVVIIGGGITGLTTAYRLHQLIKKNKLPIEVKLLEASKKVGGILRTENRDGFLLEQGPDAFISTKPWAIELCRDLGLADQLIKPNLDNPRSFIVRAGQLQPVPEGFYLMAPSSLRPFLASPIFSWRGKLRMIMDLFLPTKNVSTDESLEDFVVRRLGREAFDRMAQPMIGGIYSANPKKLSLQATMPQFLQLEQKYGSIIRALMETMSERSSGARYGIFRTFDQGIQVLVNELLKKLPVGMVETGSMVTKITKIMKPEKNDVWNIEINNQSKTNLVADQLCLALPATQMTQLLSSDIPKLSHLLESVSYASSATINLAFRRSQIKHHLGGMGFVVPAIEDRSITACTFSSLKFPYRAPEGQVLLRAFIGGALQQHLLDYSDNDLLNLVLADLQDLLGIIGQPILSQICRWNGSSPQYNLGHLERISQINLAVSKIKGLELAGNAFHGVGIPDCVNSGNKAAESIFKSLSSDMNKS